MNKDRALWVLLLTLSSSTMVRAATTEEQAEAMVTLVAEISKTEAFVLGCAEKVPQYTAANSAAFKAWKSRNGLEPLESILKNISSASPKLGDAVNEIRGSYLALVVKQPLSKIEPICKNLPQTLKQANSNTVQKEYATELKLIREFAQNLNRQSATSSNSNSSSAPSNTSSSGVLYTIPQLNTLILSTRAATPGKDSAKNKAALEKLQSLGTLYVTGTATSDSLLGFDQGKFKSKYGVYCLYQFKNQIGKTFVVSGKVKDFSPWIEMTEPRCERPQNIGGLKRSSLPDHLGLERKPLSVAEVRAKPGAGLALTALEGVYFNQTIQNKMDGFGNMYVERNSETYLLLKDGSAYAYGWSFSPQEFNATYSKKEEPLNWQRWQRKGGKLMLIERDGDQTDLGDFSRILPLPKGSTLSGSYDLLSVGAASQSSQGIELNADGSYLTFSTQILSGGKTADGTVYSTPSDPTKTEGRYQIDGYTLALTLPDGQISRVFLGVPDYEKNSKSPKWLFYRGALYSN